MTTSTNLTDRLGELVDRIQEGDRPLPWVVHTGCSYRRIASFPTREAGFRTFADGNVLHAYKQQPDGHPDLSMGERQLEALVEIVNAMPEILSALRKAEEIERLTAREAEMQSHLREVSKVITNHLGGGSEWFSRIGDEFYVDPKAIAGELQRRKEDAQADKRALYRARLSLGDEK